MTTKTIRVELEDRSYEIFVGNDVLTMCGSWIRENFPSSRVVVISDRNVAELYLAPLMRLFKESAIDALSIVVEPGEQSKSFVQLEAIVDQILAARLERGDIAVALGGGVVGDLVGFASSITRRGMNFIQIPTTLLAQVDSSVGGKTGINSVRGKNLVGSFYQPRVVFADSLVLDSLAPRHFRAGYGEMVKYGLINDPDFFTWLERYWKKVFQPTDERIEAIARSCQIKADIVHRDEEESGERALLNLGHTFGHALETATNYDSARLVHGEAVAIGVVLAYQLSAELGLCDVNVAERIKQHLQQVGLPVRLEDVAGGLPDAEALMTFIAQDKKVRNGRLTFILARGLGQAFVANNLEHDRILSFLKDKLTQK